MKRIAFCLVLAALPILGQVPEGQVPDIALYYDFEHQPPPVVQNALEGETVAILTPMRQTIEWRSLAKVRPGEVATELAVVTFKGSCDLLQPLPRASRQRTLGLTHITDGAILPFSDIDCDRIRLFLDKELQHRRPADRDGIFGRAIGRVVAHELYHIFANTTHHATAGIARSAFTVKDLIKDSFRLEEAAALWPKKGGNHVAGHHTRTATAGTASAPVRSDAPVNSLVHGASK